MNLIITILLGFLVLLFVMEAVKHLIAKKATTFILIVIVFVFILFSYTTVIEKSTIAKNNKYIQTGAVVTKEIKERVDESGFINKTLKSDTFFGD